MKLDGQTEADLGFYICFFQIYQSLGLEVTLWSRGWSGCYADSHTNLLGNQKYNHVDFWHGTVCNYLRHASGYGRCCPILYSIIFLAPH